MLPSWYAQSSGRAPSWSSSNCAEASISDGVRILSKRGSENAFSFLAIDTESPYIDTRPNLAAGPETRQYQVQYITGDDPIGNMSDLLTVTVPGQ